MSKKDDITIIYKSGAKVHLKVDSFRITKSGGELHSAEWDKADPRPLLLGVDEIAAIYEGKA